VASSTTCGGPFSYGQSFSGEATRLPKIKNCSLAIIPASWQLGWSKCRVLLI